MRSKTQNPFDGFEFVKTFDDPLYTIDPTVYKADDGKLYMCYSQNSYAYGEEQYEQRLYVREMLSPTELSEKVACISKADTKKELSIPNVKINEGPFFVKAKEKLFIIYSANGCGDENYCLCVLEYTGGDIVDAKSWKKLDEPLLYKSENLFGPGHASFFTSPNKKELWCAFHAILDMSDEKEFKDRFACINKVEIDKDGYLKMGKAKEIEETAPSGE
jgi:GH43 family beta-xylosidase